MLTPIQLPNISDVIYSELRHKIFSGEFAPGDQLNLRQLEKQLDVSRTPLKSALARLQVEGLVTIHPRRGTYVTEFSVSDIRECFELRLALELQALLRVFEPHNQAALQEIQTLLDEMSVYFQDEGTWRDQLPDFMDCDRILHLKLVELSGNGRMKQAYEHANVQGYIGIMGTKFRYADVQATQVEHQNLAEALRKRDLERVLTVEREHLEGAAERALRRLAEKAKEKAES